MSAENETCFPIGVKGDEPRAGSAPVPVWLIVLFGVLFYAGQLYLAENAGGFNSQVYEPYSSFAEVRKANPDLGVDMFAKGQELFSVRCSVCHQPNGLGQPGKYPPLAGSEWVLAPGPGRPIRIVLNSVIGEIQVKGAMYNDPAMPPWRDITSDEELAAILTYVRQSWGNNAPPVKPEQVKEIREKTNDRGTQWTAPELLTVPETE
jgi:mono/diheme cytochrome c family protein